MRRMWYTATPTGNADATHEREQTNIDSFDHVRSDTDSIMQP